MRSRCRRRRQRPRGARDPWSETYGPLSRTSTAGPSSLPPGLHLTTLQRNPTMTLQRKPTTIGVTMKTATLDRSVEPTTAPSVATVPAPPRDLSGPPDTSTRKTAVLVGLCFLAATFTFAIGNALIRSYFSSATAHNTLIAGVFLLGCCGLAVAANGAAMRRILTPHTPIRSRAYFVLRVTECLTL